MPSIKQIIRAQLDEEWKTLPAKLLTGPAGEHFVRFLIEAQEPAPPRPEFDGLELLGKNGEPWPPDSEPADRPIVTAKLVDTAASQRHGYDVTTRCFRVERPKKTKTTRKQAEKLDDNRATLTPLHDAHARYEEQQLVPFLNERRVLLDEYSKLVRGARLPIKGLPEIPVYFRYSAIELMLAAGFFRLDEPIKCPAYVLAIAPSFHQLHVFEYEYDVYFPRPNLSSLLVQWQIGKRSRDVDRFGADEADYDLMRILIDNLPKPTTAKQIADDPTNKVVCGRNKVTARLQLARADRLVRHVSDRKGWSPTREGERWYKLVQDRATHD